MRAWSAAVLAVCLLGAVWAEAGPAEPAPAASGPAESASVESEPAESAAGSPAAARAVRGRLVRRTRLPRQSGGTDGWLRLISDYLRSTGRAGTGGGARRSMASLLERAVKLDLPLGGGAAPLPVLLLPVPVPVDGEQCDAAPKPNKVYLPSEVEVDEGRRPSYQPDPYRDRRPIPADGGGERRRPGGGGERRRPSGAGQRRPSGAGYHGPGVGVDDYSPSSPAPFAPSGNRIDDYEPHPSIGQASSQYLVSLFNEQEPQGPEYPPMLLAESPPPGQPGPLPPLAAPTGPGREPPRPQLARSLRLRGELTVRRADYTEPYDVWYDAASGASRMDLHGGATTVYRSVNADGSLRRVQALMDRTGEAGEVRHCLVMEAGAASATDRVPPAMPDVDQFNFDGYEDADSGRLERWVYRLEGQAGQLGAADGEALTFRHTMLAARAADGQAVPMKYSVEVDSSMLGPKCDEYEHRYLELTPQEPDPNLMHIDIERECGIVEHTDRVERVDPLREFSLPQRDARYDGEFQEYMKKYNREYADENEKAMRKNVFMQSMRFIESGNRQGSPARLGQNFLTDRLVIEIKTITGIKYSPSGFAAEPFPYSRSRTRSLDGQLPRKLDWRALGAVTHVRYQANCPSCWAFAVVAAVEGALFLRTGQLVPLSDKNLLDCGHRETDKECTGTWLDVPYLHIKDKGIVALADYSRYRPRVDPCQEKSIEPVTFISGYVNVTSFSVPALKVALKRHGPNAVLVHGTCNSFTKYMRGVLVDYRCKKSLQELDHAVTAVGYGSQRSGRTYFTNKNSWGSSFGEGGYIRLDGGSNTAGVLTMPSYPVITEEDVGRLSGAGQSFPDETGGEYQFK